MHFVIGYHENIELETKARMFDKSLIVELERMYPQLRVFFNKPRFKWYLQHHSDSRPIYAYSFDQAEVEAYTQNLKRVIDLLDKEIQ